MFIPDVEYRGQRNEGGVSVTRLAPGEHPAGLEGLDGCDWSCGAEGAKCLALALLVDALTGLRCGASDGEEIAQSLHLEFARQVVAGFGDAWRITRFSIVGWVCGAIDCPNPVLARMEDPFYKQHC